jgi:hypothetical protein
MLIVALTALIMQGNCSWSEDSYYHSVYLIYHFAFIKDVRPFSGSVNAFPLYLAIRSHLTAQQYNMAHFPFLTHSSPNL